MVLLEPVRVTPVLFLSLDYIVERVYIYLSRNRHKLSCYATRGGEFS